MNAGQVVSYAIAAASAVAALLAYFKFKPGQKESVVITAAEANLNIAKGTINLVTEEYESQFKRMAGEGRELQKDLRQLRRDLDDYQEEARVLRLAVRDLKSQNESLAAEVADLRAENARLHRLLTGMRGEPDA